MTSTAIGRLQQACTNDSLSASASLSPDGRTLTIDDTVHDATALVTLPLTDKAVTYSLASIYLLLANPSVLQYRKACEAVNVGDVVKILDKAGIHAYFFGAASVAEDDRVGDVPDRDSGLNAALPSKQTDDQAHEHRSKRHDDKDRHPVKSAKRHEKAHKTPSSSSSSYKKSSKPKHDEEDHKKKAGKPVPITNEQLVANLSTIVDKRDKNKTKPVASAAPPVADEHTTTSAGHALDARQITPSSTPLSVAAQDEHEREMLLASLSPEGFDVHSPQVLAAIEADREAVRRITALEIPVGDSSSILRAGAGGEIADASNGTTAGSTNVKKRDFSRVLELYQEVLQAEEKAKRVAAPDNPRSVPSIRPSASAAPLKKIQGNPIIIVPNAMTSCITLVNAGFFLGKEATFVPRDAAVRRPDAGKRGNILRISRKLPPRLGGGEITYDVIDNPTTRLKKDDWERVVAVVAQGASWQFKGWRYSDPVELFSRAFGFYVGYEGAAVPTELAGWNVKLGKVSRDRRGLDNICLAGFWNGLEEFMAVHKQGFFRST